MSFSEITIVIPAYNSSAFLKKTIESLLEQTFQAFTLIIRNDCSTDNTASIVALYAAKDNRVHLIEGQKRLKMIGNWNACLALAHKANTPYFMLLFHDDFLLSNQALEKAITVLKNQPQVAAVYSNMVFVDEQNRTIMSRKFLDSGLLEPRILAKKSIVAGRNLFGIPLLIRNNQVFKVDLRLTYVGDIDISMMSAKDAKVFRISEALIAYRVHGNNATHGLFQQTQIQMHQLAIKHEIFLSSYDKIKMNINTCLVIWQKKIFFFYINRIRKGVKRVKRVL